MENKNILTAIYAYAGWVAQFITVGQIGPVR